MKRQKPKRRPKEPAPPDPLVMDAATATAAFIYEEVLPLAHLVDVREQLVAVIVAGIEGFLSMRAQSVILSSEN